MNSGAYLIPAKDHHFAWMLGEASANHGLSLAPGGVDHPDVIRMLRQVAADLRPLCAEASWLIICDNEVVGLCSIKRLLDDGAVEIGFGIAAGRRRLGYATTAIRAMLARLDGCPIFKVVVATTSLDNIASQRALRRNGFAESGRTWEPDEGELMIWRYTLRQNSN